MNTEAAAPLTALTELDNLVKHYRKPEILTLTCPDGDFDAKVAALPDSVKLVSIKSLIDEYRTEPERRKGTAHFYELASFLEHVARFMDADSAIFVNPDAAAPSFTAVLDYHRVGSRGDPRFGTHRSVYQPALSDEWQAWLAQDGKPMSQSDFAEFIEDRIGDVRQADLMAPGQNDPETEAQRKTREIGEMLQGTFAGPMKLMELSRGLKVNVSEQTAQAVTLASGEAQVTFKSEHKDADGKKLIVPSLFQIGIPAFRNGGAYVITVRLRYRVKAGQLIWLYQLYRTDKVLQHVIDGCCATAKAMTGLPVLVGAPE